MQRTIARRSKTLVAGLTAALVPVTLTVGGAGASPPPPHAGTSAGAWDACGGTVYKRDGTPWRCSFTDDFGGLFLDRSKWSVLTTDETGFHGGQECLVDSSGTVSVYSGELHLTTRKTWGRQICENPWGGSHRTRYVSGAVTTRGLFEQAYGRFAFRARFPDVTVPGLYDGLWLYPAKPTYGAHPRSGEIDLAEHYSAWPHWINHNIKYQGWEDDPTRTARQTCRISDPAGYHTYVLEWSPSTITMIYDGQTCWSTSWRPDAPLSAPQPFDQPFFMILNQAVGYGANAPDPQLRLPATMDVDWVRAWR